MGNLRIIAGTARGIRIQSVPGDTTRPITDRVKESLFNIIGPDIVGSTFLDLFGGTGSVGIEALSRGAEAVTFVDLNSKSVNTIRANLAATRLEIKRRSCRGILSGFFQAHRKRLLITSTLLHRNTGRCGFRRCSWWTKILPGFHPMHGSLFRSIPLNWKKSG